MLRYRRSRLTAVVTNNKNNPRVVASKSSAHPGVEDLDNDSVVSKGDNTMSALYTDNDDDGGNEDDDSYDGGDNSAAIKSLLHSIG